MKTYKTWEVVKMVEENPEREFESEGAFGGISCKSNGKFVEFKRGINNIYRISMDRDWVEITEPMKFQEVLELISSFDVSYNVKLQLILEPRIYTGDLDDILMELSNGLTDYGISELLLNGRWYIC